MKSNLINLLRQWVPWLSGVLWLGALAWLAYPALNLSFDNDHWLADSHPIEQNLHQLTDRFGQANSALLVLELDAPYFATESFNSQLKQLRSLETAIRELPLVHTTTSLQTAQTIIKETLAQPLIDEDYDDDFDEDDAWFEEETLTIKSYLQSYRDGNIDAKYWQNSLAQGPYAGRLLSHSGRLYTIVVDFTDEASESDIRNAAFVALNALLSQRWQKAFHLVGDSALKSKLDRILSTEIFPLLGLATLLGLILVGFLTASLPRAIVIVGLSTLCAIVALGAYSRFGVPFTTISLVLPILVLVVATADALHVFGRWDVEYKKDPNHAFKNTLSCTWLPCLIASVTTALGCGSFFLSELLPLSEFAIYGSLSVLLAYPVLFIPLTTLLALFPEFFAPKVQRRPFFRRPIFTRIGSQIQSIATLGQRYPRLTLLVWIIFLIPSIWGVANIRTESNFLEVFFADDSPTKMSFGLVNEEFPGTGVIDVLLLHPDAEHFKSFTGFSDLIKVSESIKLPDIRRVDDYSLPLSVVHEAFDLPGKLPSSSGALNDELFFLELSQSESEAGVLKPWLSFKADSARIRLITPDLNSNALTSLLQELEARLAGWDQSYNVVVTGSSHYIQALSSKVLDTQISAVTVMLACIFVILVLSIGYVWGILGLVTNVFPILITAGSITLIGLPFDFGTILVTSLTLGLAVDACIHLLSHARRGYKDAGNYSSAIQIALRETYTPILQTTVVVSIGILSLWVSQLVLVQHFSAFSFMGVIISGLAALTIPQAIISIIQKTTQSNHTGEESTKK